MHLIRNKKELMFGLSIKLDHYLGIIYQPTLNYIIEKDIEIEDIYYPFIVDKNICSDGLTVFDTFIQLKKVYHDDKIIDKLLGSLKILYMTEDVKLNEDTETIVINERYTLNKDNYNYLCENVAEIFMLDLKDIQKKYDEIKKERERPKTERDRKIAEAKARSMRNRPKEDVFDLIDMSNYLIHSSEKYTYENILNMTVWQIKNSFNLYNKKENYDMEKRYRTSGNFDMGKEKQKHWFFKN